MTSAPVPREPADPPSVNVLRSSLALFSLYIATTVIVSLALAAASIDLHPATRFFIWLVMSAAVGYGLLRRHGRYPSPPTLGLILGLAIFWILGMSVAATLRLDDSAEALTPQLGAFAFNTVALLLVGAAGLQLAGAIFSRRNRAR
jgi:hypothetical protein